MIQNVTFTGAGKTNYYAQYMERKAAQIEADLQDTIRTAGRVIINKNREASKAGQYLPADAYFGPVPVKAREIGQNKIMDSIAVTKTNVPDLYLNKSASNEIIPENSINFVC